MKRFAALLLTIWISANAQGQDFSGQWNGLLKVQEVQLRLVFHLIKTHTGYSATMDSPDQGVKGVPTVVTVEQDNITLSIAAAHITYHGTLKNEKIEGTFQQGTAAFPMTLNKETETGTTFKRPQEPQEPFPYYTEEVTFTNPKADNITLSGTLSLPKKEGVFAAVILISGSGPQNRDEELLGHKPFLVLADDLTRHGIAVLRYDDRGVAQSKGNFKTATTADFASDVQSALDYLKTRKEINPKKIGLLGHSEGGLIAPMVAAESKDVRFIALLAAPGLRGDALLLQQQELIGKASGATATELKDTRIMNSYCFNEVLKAKDEAVLKADLMRYLAGILKDTPKEQKPENLADEDNAAMQVSQICNPWMLYFLRYDPTTALANVKCPVLAINGAQDLQVAPQENLDAIEKALHKAGNQKVTTKVFPNLNHLFQECKTGLPDEYAAIEQTFSPVALNFITQWIQNQTK
ncbi:alpha/beta hydrolase family protein [Flavobacterium sp. XGLA_31]|uniref:alpha/beta hydrolase family protein n=1 Tax=Flavobacterium sp. XGLA_31 TaxID=3447666 RepID=UPI003F3609BF